MLRLRARDLIRDLKALLGERYRNDQDGFSILKEVLQNADDVRASKVWLAWWEGGVVPPGANDLLARPGFLLINDAGFELRHEEAFTSFSTSSKDSDAAQIGRFGIGRKSLFHWSEAVCYLGVDAAGQTHGGVLDPWAEQRLDGTYFDRQHPSWPQWGQAEEEALRGRIAACAPELGQGWFGIWLPARAASRDGRRRIIPTFPSYATLPTDLERLSALARLLPQLVSLREVVVLSHQGGARVVHGHIERSGDPLGRAATDGPAYEVARQGEARVRAGEQRCTIRYHIAEACRWTPELTALREDAGWPEEPAVDLDGDDASPTKAKAEPQGAVTVVWQEGRPGNLSLVPAIFLPVSGSRLLERFDLPAISVGCDLLLHGYFFPDSGRQEIEGLGPERTSTQDASAIVRRAWNVQVRRDVTLPLLLPAFGRALAEVDASAVPALIQALAGSELVREEVDALTRDVQLGCGPGFDFRMLPGDARWIELPGAGNPALAADLARAGQALTGLGVTPLWSGRRGVVAPAHQLSWERPLVERLAAELAEPCRRAPRQWVPWVREWITTARFAEDASPAPVVRELYLGCLRHTSWRALLEQEEWATIAQCLRPEVTSVFWADHQAIAAFRGLGSSQNGLAERLPILVLDRDVPHENLPPGRFEPADAVAMLEAIADAHAQKRARPLTQLATLVLDASDWQSLVEASALHHKAFVPVWKTTESSTLVSVQALEQGRDRRLAFESKGVMQATNFALKLSAALAGSPEIILVTGDFAARFALAHFDLASVAVALCEHAITLDTAARLEFITLVKRQMDTESIVAGALSAPMRVGLRRLLGGDAVRDLDTELLVVSQRLSHSLVVSLLGSEPWRALEPEVARYVQASLPGVWWTALAMKDADASDLVAAVRRLAGDERALASALGALADEDRSRLGTYLLEDRNLWTDVPVHRTVDGRWVDLTGPAYLDSKYQVPARLGQLDLIEVPAEAAYAKALRDTIPTWSVDELVRLGLARDDWRLVLEALATDHEAQRLWELTQIGNARWIPTLAGEQVPPDRVIIDHDLHGVTRALPVQPKDVTFLDELAPELRQHPNWPHVEKRLVAKPRSAEVLIAQLENQRAQAELSLGPGAADSARGWLAKILATDPVWAWWEVIKEVAPQVAQARAELVTGPCTPKRAMSLLRSAASSTQPVPSDALAWYGSVLAALKGEVAHIPRSELAGLALPDAARALRPTSQLVRGTRALPDAHRVHPKLEQLFAVPPVTTFDEEVELQHVTRLEDWIEPWDDGKTPVSLLGFLVSLFAVGDDPYAVHLFRRLLPADAASSIARRLLQTSGAAEADVEARIAQVKRTRLRVEQVTPGSSQRVVALDGTGFDVTFQEEYDSLLVDILEGLPPSEVGSGSAFGAAALKQLELMRPTRRVRMWQLEPATEPEARIELIGATIEAMLREFYQLPPKRGALDDLLKKQTEDARHVIVAQHRLVRWLPQSLRQLRVHKLHQPLEDALSAIERAEHTEEELRSQSAGASESRQAAAAVEQARAQLRKLVEQDAPAQGRVLTALRERLKESQYCEEQVLFELFQNADDAYAQRSEAADAAERPSFDVEFGEVDGRRTLTVRHRGRAIDRMYRTEDASKGWNRDLVNMLALGFSDKGAQDTGKFGLGFKSAYLIADEVHIQSGRSAIKVVGGVLPFPTHAFASPDETTFRFFLTSSVTEDVILDRFRRLSPLATLFAQEIQRVTTTSGSRQDSASARVETLAESSDTAPPVHLLAVDLRSPDPGVGGRWLVARDARSGRGVPRVMALRVESGEIARVGELPTVWVTTPTRESRRLGFLVGGPFGIDVGRGRLGEGEVVEDPAVTEIVALARRALDLIEDRLLRDDDTLGLTLGIGAKSSRVAASLFDVLITALAQPEGSWERRLAVKVLAPPLLERVRLITDMDGVRRRPSEVRCVLSAELARPQVWEVMRQHFPLSSVAIVEDRDGQLEDLGYGGERPVKTVLALVAEAMPASSRLNREAAVRLLALEKIQPRSPAPGDSERQGLDAPTWESLRKHGSDLVVVHQANGTVRLGDVILDQRFKAGTDEALIAAFAPAARKLATDDADIARCVALFRQRAAVSSEDLCKWATAAATDAARAGVVTYLFEGERRDDVVPALRESTPTWLDADVIRREGARQGRDRMDIDGLLVRLGLEEIARPMLWPTLPDFVAQPQFTLQHVLTWWVADGAKFEQAYQQRVYPAPWARQDELAEALRGGDPRAWATLFALAICQRLGRVQPGQNRGFLESHPDWIETLADPHSTAERWIALIDDWAAANSYSEEYSHWLGLFPAFRRLWHAMRDLTGLLVTRPPVDLGASEIFSFPSNASLSGAGVSIPNIARVFGGKGRIWVARELVRLGVWAFDPRQRYYVPWKLACSMTGDPEGDSDGIAKALERQLGIEAPFGRCFDLPFDILRFDKGLREHLSVLPDQGDAGDDWAMDDMEYGEES